MCLLALPTTFRVEEQLRKNKEFVRKWERERERVCVFVCVSVWEREREREREWEKQKYFQDKCEKGKLKSHRRGNWKENERVLWRQLQNFENQCYKQNILKDNLEYMKHDILVSLTGQFQWLNPLFLLYWILSSQNPWPLPPLRPWRYTYGRLQR